MAQGKNKGLAKSKKGKQKKTIDPLSRKEWYNLKAPVPFENRAFGYTPVTKSSGTRIATDYVKGRVIESSLADLMQKEDKQAWRKVRLIVDDVEGMNAKTTFYGLDITKDKLCSMIRKWQSITEAFVDCKTADGYVLRVFTIAFSKRVEGQKCKTSYIKGSQDKAIRAKITAILTQELAKLNINEAIKHLIGKTYTEKIQTATQYIYPLKDITIRKVKVLRRPKIDSVKLNEMYTHPKNTGRDRAGVQEDAAAQNKLTAELQNKQ